jgi:hypothetical protein
MYTKYSHTLSSPLGQPITGLSSVSPASLVRTSGGEEYVERKISPPGAALLPTPVDDRPVLKDASQALISMRFPSGKEMRMILGASYQVSSGSSGITNQTVNVNLVSVLSDFISMATLFNEFFVTKMEVTYEPQSRYSKQATVGGVRQVTDVPLVVATLQHAMPTYPDHSSACQNGDLKICNSADPWKVRWSNNEKKSSTVAPVPESTTALALPTQSWCSTNSPSSQVYTGALQILSPTAIPNSLTNYLYGSVVVRWEVFFRSRF